MFESGREASQSRTSVRANSQQVRYFLRLHNQVGAEAPRSANVQQHNLLNGDINALSMTNAAPLSVIQFFRRPPVLPKIVVPLTV